MRVSNDCYCIIFILQPKWYFVASMNDIRGNIWHYTLSYFIPPLQSRQSTILHQLNNGNNEKLYTALIFTYKIYNFDCKASTQNTTNLYINFNQTMRCHIYKLE